ncbi:hypothetical protein BDR26DRAFT_898190 [Obelidium mucronatum]|nr:hypothetical protein BDR26DRAFT_898190 [Obelidium mucronatum]
MTFYNVIKTFVYLSPIALLPQFIPSILVQADVISKNKGKLFTGVLTGTAAGFTITFDAILLYSFIKYVRDMENVSAFLACPRLVIVSRYGIFATSFGILAVILFSLSYAFKDELVQTVGIVSFAVLEVLYCVLVGMKVSLHVNHIRETSRKESAIEHARMISGGGRASGSVKTPSASQG